MLDVGDEVMQEEKRFLKQKAASLLHEDPSLSCTFLELVHFGVPSLQCSRFTILSATLILVYVEKSLVY